jgi:hypothetical protein
MTHRLNISQPNPIIHIKAYGGVKIEGVDETQVQCEIDAPQLATLIEENDHVYLTANSSCNVTVPMASAIEIEKGMGSISIHNIQGSVTIEKVLGNLVMDGIDSARVEKIGGNCAIRNASGAVHLEKVGGNLIIDKAGSLYCEKVGGVCKAKDIAGDFKVDKVGGGFKAEHVTGLTGVSRVGADFKAADLALGDDIHAGGDIRIARLSFKNDVDLFAGGDVVLSLDDSVEGARMGLTAGGYHIRIVHEDDDVSVEAKKYDYEFGTPRFNVDIAAGGKILIGEALDEEVGRVGDLSGFFAYEESALNEMIKERVESATRRAEAKIKATEIRLEHIQDEVEKNRGFRLDLELDDLKKTKLVTPVPPVTRKAGKKGASDEERLMILKMLQDKQITVDEAEALFKALES